MKLVTKIIGGCLTSGAAFAAPNDYTDPVTRTELSDALSFYQPFITTSSAFNIASLTVPTGTGVISPGAYGRISEMHGALATILGNGIKSHDTLDNTVVTTGEDSGQYIQLNYSQGISFHTHLGGAMGTAFASTENERMRIGLGGNVSIGGLPNDEQSVKLTVRDTTDALLSAVQIKTLNDSINANYEGGTLVKHDKFFEPTPGYGGTFQVYNLSGGSGLILGSNKFVGETDPPVPNGSSVPNGFIRFELGPLWPASEKMRLNNTGDLIVGWTTVREHTASQTETTVTATVGDFAPSDVGKWFCWSDATGGFESYTDQITAFISASQVTVETSRSIISHPARVCSANTWVSPEGAITASNVTVSGRLASAAKVPETLAAGATTLAITSNVATVTGDPARNTLLTITGGVSGQILTLIFTNAVTIRDTAAPTANTVNLSGAFTSVANGTLSLVFNGTKWFETARSNN